jgi:hypothetical protein
MSGSCTPYAAKITHPSTVHDRFNGATTSPINMASEMDLHVWNGKVNARGNPLIGSRRSRSKLLKTHSGKFLSSEGRGIVFREMFVYGGPTSKGFLLNVLIQTFSV